MVKANIDVEIWKFRIRESWHAYESCKELAAAFHMDRAYVAQVGREWRSKGFQLKAMPDE